MGVTIDQIQVEIQSSSNNAAQGITDLAKALGELKKNGATGTATKNLQKLSDSLRGFASSSRAANSLRTLANSMEKLKSVGSVSNLTNSLTKLPGAFKALESVNVGNIAPQIERIVAAVSPLAQVKNSGFSSMVNSMSKLKAVTDSLNETTLDEFEIKIKKLTAIVEPLATKLGTVKTALAGVNTQLKQTNVTVEQTNEKLNVNVFNISNMINVFSALQTTLQGVISFFANVIHQASQWDGIKYQFGNAFGEQADMYYEKITQITDALNINKQTFMENSAMAASMLIGFGVDKADAREMGLGYTQLAYDIWAAFNNVYETLDGADGAMAAVRSAIAGEVEPIRRAGFTIVEATLEQTAANHGLEISLANATEAQKSYLRYLELVDQAQRKGVVGTYAREMNTAEGMMRTFSQQIKSLTQAFGSLFIPILVKVMPYLQAFVELLTEGVHWIAALFGIKIQDIGDTWNDYSSGVGNAVENTEGMTNALGSATKAAKELKNATLGIDELNVISPTSASNGSGAGGSGVGGAGGSGFEGLDIDSIWDQSILDGIQQDVDKIKEKMQGWLVTIAAVTTAIAGVRLVKFLKDVKALEKIKSITIFKDIKDFFLAAKQMAPEVGWLAALFPKLSTALSGIGAALAGVSAPVWAGIAAAIVAVGSAIYFIVENFDELKQAFKDFFAENIAPKLEEIGKHFEKIKEALGPLWTNVLQPLINLIKSIDWGKIFGTIAEGLGALVTALVTGPLMGALNQFMSVLEGIVQVFSGVIQIVRGFVDIVVGLFTGDLNLALEGVKRIGNGIVDVFAGLYDATIGGIVELVEGVIDWFTELWDVLVGHSIVPDTVNAIVKWFTSLPSKIFGSIQNFVTGIIDKFKNLGSGLTEKFTSAWNAVKSWWSKKPGLASYTPSIGSIYNKLKERWDSARTWWNDKKTKAKEYTPSIGSIYEKLSTRWKNARDWWNSKKGSMSYTPSIGSIVDKVKSAWNTAKSWWNKNVKLSTKLDVKVPKISVKWDTASAFGKSFKYPTGFSLKFAANGGIFDQGSMIWAGERGPEIVANAAGGKTGVMNVQQMQEAVYEGVYTAMSAAVRGMSGGGSQEVRVYLDGREISASVKKHQHESGASLMGNEVYSF